MSKKIKLMDISANLINEIDLDDKLMIEAPHNQSMFDSVIAEDASKRQGTHSTLTKAEVSGGGRKPFKQKHTGRARQGSIRNPHYRHGGVAFGPKPTRNYKLKINKKVYSLAFKSALTSQINNNAIYAVANDINIEKPSSKLIVDFLKKMNFQDNKVLFVIKDKNLNLVNSIKNIDKVDCKNWHQVSIKDILNANYIFIQQDVLNKWVEAYR